jgi:hypothetical protein
MNLDDEQNRAAILDWVDVISRARTQYTERAKAKLPQLPLNYAEAAARLKDESKAHDATIRQAISFFSRAQRWPTTLTDRDLFFLDWRVSCALIILGQVFSPDDPPRPKMFVDAQIIAAVSADTDDFTKRMLIELWDQFGDIYLRGWLALPAPVGQ